MSLYSIIYLVLSMLIMVFVIRSKLDILSIGAVCFIVYTIYCIPGIGISGFYRPTLSPQLYYLVYMQLILIFAFVYTNKQKVINAEPVPSSRKIVLSYNDIDVSTDKTLTDSFVIYTCVMVFFLLVNLISIGIFGLAAGKEFVWQRTNILYIICLYGAFPSFVYGIHTRNKWIWLPSIIIELTIFFAGSRAFLATLIIIFLLEQGANLWEKRENNKMIFLAGAIAVVFLLIYRMIDQQIMQGDIEGAFITLSKSETWIKALEFNEPRVIIANYDYVLTSGLRLPFSDIIYRFLDIIPGLTSLIPIRLEYPEYFSTWLSDQVNSSAGVGGTIWGESYAMFGVIGVFTFTLIWLQFLKVSNEYLKHHKKYSSFVISIGTYLAWYINRLDYNRVFQAIKVTIFCFLIWSVIYIALGGDLVLGKYRIRVRDDSAGFESQ